MSSLVRNKDDSWSIPASKVEDVIKSKGFILDMKKLREQEEKRKSNRTIGQVASSHSMNAALTGNKPDQLVQSWFSFDDHIKKLEEQIHENYCVIYDAFMEIEGLEKKIDEVKAEKQTYDTSTYKASIKPYKRADYDHPTAEETKWELAAAETIREHELKYHPAWVNASLNHDYKAAKQPSYSFESSSSHIGFIKYIICEDCKRAEILKSKGDWRKEKYSRYHLDIFRAPGAS